MSWKLPVLICVFGLGGLALLCVIALNLLGAAGVSITLYSIEAKPMGIGFSLFFGLAGLITYLVFRKPSSTPNP